MRRMCYAFLTTTRGTFRTREDHADGRDVRERPQMPRASAEPADAGSFCVYSKNARAARAARQMIARAFSSESEVVSGKRFEISSPLPPRCLPGSPAQTRGRARRPAQTPSGSRAQAGDLRLPACALAIYLAAWRANSCFARLYARLASVLLHATCAIIIASEGSEPLAW